MSGSMDGTVALVTGGSSGIGRATALAFAREGAKVVVADVLIDKARETVDLITRSGGEALFIKTDVSLSGDVQMLVEKTVKKFGRLDSAFNNAGIEGETAKTAECTEENWEKVININLRGVWLCMKYEIPVMLKQKSGAIVNTSSIAGQVAFEGIPAYCASKGGVNQLTRTAAMEYAKTGIRINAVCPGVIWTPMVDRFTKGDKKAAEDMAALEPVGRMGKPEEIAEAVLWLCSKGASFVTGHPLVVDGGWVAR